MQTIKEFTEELRELRKQGRVSISLEQLKKKNINFDGLGRRNSPRFELKFTIIAIGKRESFRCQTVNISESGALLSDLLPTTFMTESFDLVMIMTEPQSQKTKYLLFTAKAVGGPLRTNRILFRETTSQSSEQLKSRLSEEVPINNHW